METANILAKFNIYRSSSFTNQQLILSSAIMIGTCFFILFMSQLSGGLIMKTMVQERICQLTLSNVKGLVEGHNLSLNELIKNSLNCFACFNNVQDYSKPFAIENELIFVNSTTKKAFDTSYSLIGTYNRPSQEKCWKNANNITTLTDFPSVSNQFEDQFPSRGFHIFQDDKMDTLHFVCNNKQCTNKNVLFKSSDKNLKEIYIFQQYMTTDFNASVNYSVYQYNDKYFVNNQIFFLFWVGIELLFALLVFAIGEDTNIDYSKVLVETQSQRKIILFTLILNNNPTFPIQIWKDSFTLRYINILSSCGAQFYLLYYIMETLRKVRQLRILILFIDRSQTPSFIFKSFHLIISGFIHFNLAIILTSSAISLESDIISLPNDNLPKINLIFLQIGLVWSFGYILMQLVFGLLKIRKQQIFTKEFPRYYRSRKIFLYYGSIGGFIYILRELKNFNDGFAQELIYFDQFITTLINIFFIILMWFFDVEVEESQELTIEDDETTL